MISINLNPENRDLRLFSGLLVPFSFLVGYLVRHYLLMESAGWCVTILLATAGLTGLIRPGWIRWLFVGWMILAFPFGWVFSHLILAVIFYGIFFPFGLVARSRGYDPLQLARTESDSFWVDLGVEEQEVAVKQASEPEVVKKRMANKARYFRQF